MRSLLWPDAVWVRRDVYTQHMNTRKALAQYLYGIGVHWTFEEGFMALDLAFNITKARLMIPGSNA